MTSVSRDSRRGTLLGFSLAKKSSEGDEIRPGARGVSRQGNHLELRKSLADTAAEQDATYSRHHAASGDLAGRLPAGRRAVDRALARDDEVVAGRVEAGEIEDERCTGHQLCAQRRERGTETA